MKRAMYLFIICVLLIHVLGCLVSHHFNFIKLDLLYTVGDWKLDKVILDYSYFGDKKTYQYLFDINVIFSPKIKNKTYPFFENDFVIDTVFIESTDSDFKTQSLFDDYLGWIYVLDDSNERNHISVKKLSWNVFELVRRDSLYNPVDTIFVKLSKVQSFFKDFKDFYSTGGAAKILHFHAITIPPKVKNIKLSFMAKIVNHLTSEIMESRYIEIKMQRRDYKKWHIGI